MGLLNLCAPGGVLRTYSIATTGAKTTTTSKNTTTKITTLMVFDTIEITLALNRKYKASSERG